jgi:hypothetical protein
VCKAGKKERKVITKNSAVAHSVARWRFSPPDLDNSGGFESCSGGNFLFLAGSQFLADLTNSAQVYFCLKDLADFWRFLSLF